MPGCVFSVALSLRLPSLGVTQHSALWSSDFPRKKYYFFRDYLIYLSNILFSILKYHFNKIKSINLKESIEYIVSSIELRKRKKRCKHNLFNPTALLKFALTIKFVSSIGHRVLREEKERA